MELTQQNSNLEGRTAMRANQRLDFDALRDEASAAVGESGLTQRDLASALGVSPGAMSNALSRSGARFWKLQARIIEHLTPYRIEEEVVRTYRAVRQEKSASDQERNEQR